jgi:hypothetical protein
MRLREQAIDTMEAAQRLGAPWPSSRDTGSTWIRRHVGHWAFQSNAVASSRGE